MLLLDEPFGALDAFTREELWCILRDLWTAQRFNVILVTHDLREAVFLADTVYVMSKQPRAHRWCGARSTLPRPRDLEVTYTKEFTDIVHELREHIGAIRKPLRRSGRAMTSARASSAGRPGCCWSRCWCSGRRSAASSASRSSSSRARARIAHAAGRVPRRRSPATPGARSGSRWSASASAIVVGMLLGFLIGSSRLAYAAMYPLMTGFNAMPKAAFVPILVVWFGIGVGPGGADGVPDLVLPDHGQHRHRPGDDRARAGGRAARRSARKRWDVLIKIGLPRSMPYFYAR